MNTYTGEIGPLTELLKEAEGREYKTTMEPVVKPIDIRNLSSRLRAQLEETGRTQVSRNSPCPCGSRKRFKRCCMQTEGA